MVEKRPRHAIYEELLHPIPPFSRATPLSLWLVICSFFPTEDTVACMSGVLAVCVIPRCGHGRKYCRTVQRSDLSHRKCLLYVHTTREDTARLGGATTCHKLYALTQIRKDTCPCACISSFVISSYFRVASRHGGHVLLRIDARKCLLSF